MHSQVAARNAAMSVLAISARQASAVKSFVASVLEIMNAQWSDVSIAMVYYALTADS